MKDFKWTKLDERHYQFQYQGKGLLEFKDNDKPSAVIKEGDTITRCKFNGRWQPWCATGTGKWTVTDSKILIPKYWMQYCLDTLNNSKRLFPIDDFMKRNSQHVECLRDLLKIYMEQA